MTEASKVTPQLPKGWILTTLEEVTARISNGTTEKQTKADKGVPVTRIETISNEIIDLSRVGFLSNPSPELIERFQLSTGDILFSHINSDSHLGKTALFKLESCTLLHGMNLLLIRPSKEAIIPEFLNHLFRFYRFSGNFVAIAQHAVNQSSINQTKLKQLQVPVAPMAEQRRIVVKIEELFSFLDAGTELLRKVQAQLKRYRQAVLKYAFEGKLTEEWRKNQHASIEPASHLISKILEANQAAWESGQRQRVNMGNQAQKSSLWIKKYGGFPSENKGLAELPEHWIWVTAGQLFWSITSGSRWWAKYYSQHGAFFIRVGDLSHNITSINFGNAQFVNPPAGAEVKRTKISSGDILISITADVGRIALVAEGVREAYVNQHVALAKSTPLFNRSYLAWFLLSPMGQKQLTGLQYGATKAGLGLDEIRRVNVPFAPLSEQNIITEKIGEHLFGLKKMEEIVEQNLKRADGLRQSILKAAFMGNLVSQNPNDEPVEMLLERIKAERFNNGKSKIANLLELSGYVK